jgi:hypothetical protein
VSRYSTESVRGWCGLSHLVDCDITVLQCLTSHSCQGGPTHLDESLMGCWRLLHACCYVHGACAADEVAQTTPFSSTSPAPPTTAMTQTHCQMRHPTRCFALIGAAVARGAVPARHPGHHAPGSGECRHTLVRDRGGGCGQGRRPRPGFAPRPRGLVAL